MSIEKLPLISIIVPSYNEEKHISRCLDSILAQTFENFEVICVDDNSTDSTFKILKEYSQKDSRIKPFKNPGKGVSSARNFGIKNSGGDYIGFVDSDDFIQPQMYEFLIRAATENNTDLSICYFERSYICDQKYFDYKSEVISIEDLIDFSTFSVKDSITESVCSKLFKKDLLTNVYFDSELILGEDQNFSIQVFIKTDKFSFIDIPLYIYYYNNQSTSTEGFQKKKWFDAIVSRFKSYDLFDENSCNKILKYILLNQNFRSIPSYLYQFKDDKAFVNEITKISKKYLKEYLSCKYISFKIKIFVFLYFNFKPLYYFYRYIFKIINRD